MNGNKVEITIANRTIIRVIATVVVTIVGFQLIRNLAGVLQLIFIAFFLSVALNPAVSWIARNLKLKSRVAATAIAYLVVVLILGAFIALVLPPLVRQTYDFVQDLPRTVESLRNGNSPLGQLVEKYNLEDQITGFSTNLRERVGDLQEPVIATASRAGAALISTITVLVLTFMMLVEGPKWLAKYSGLLSPRQRQRQKRLALQMYQIVTGYVNGQVLLALLAASLAFVALVIVSQLLNVTINAVALAGILAFTGLIPMIGSTIGGAIVVLACLFVSVPLAIIFAIYFVVYQQIENITLQPYIQSRYNELTPLLVFVAALVGIGAMGFLGALIAIPAAGCAKILLIDYLESRAKKSKAA